MLPPGERRQRVRHKVHTPVFASFSGPKQGMVLDLSELLDLTEDGFSVQTSEPLEVNRPVNVCLDLPETKSYVHATGHVVWNDVAGRAGVRLSGIGEQPRRLLKEWLFVNLLIAAANHSARTRQLELVKEKLPLEPVQRPEIPLPTIPASTGPVADLSSLLFAVDAVRRELRSHQSGFDDALQFLTERALSLTGATGAALAFLTEGAMVCRGSAGNPAPPLQSVVDNKEGFSGECVRNARTIVCEDAETDLRVDRELCQILRIRSIMATPIVSDFRVIGLLEVLSPHPRTFAKIHEIVLERLAELVPKLGQPPPPKPPSETTGSPDGQTISLQESAPTAEMKAGESSVEQQPDGVPIRRLHLGLLTAAVAIGALALGYFLAPTIERHWLMRPETSVEAASVDRYSGSSRLTSGPVSLGDLRRFAEQGDADAQWSLGERYHNGEGVAQDDAAAVHWFERAAEQGYIPAQGALGAYYWIGRGVPQDLSKAYFWSVLAMAQGDETSKSRVEGLTSQMTPSQILAARQQAENWIRQHPNGVKLN